MKNIIAEKTKIAVDINGETNVDLQDNCWQFPSNILSRRAHNQCIDAYSNQQLIEISVLYVDHGSEWIGTGTVTKLAPEICITLAKPIHRPEAPRDRLIVIDCLCDSSVGKELRLYTEDTPIILGRVDLDPTLLAAGDCIRLHLSTKNITAQAKVVLSRIRQKHAISIGCQKIQGIIEEFLPDFKTITGDTEHFISLVEFWVDDIESLMD